MQEPWAKHCEQTARCKRPTPYLCVSIHLEDRIQQLHCQQHVTLPLITVIVLPPPNGGLLHGAAQSAVSMQQRNRRANLAWFPSLE
jgi:hypothetical protein